MGTASHLLEPVAVTWSIAGLIASALVAAAAFIRSRGPGGFYDRDVYGMTARAHLRYAIASAAFAVAFLFAWIASADALTLWIFTGFALFAVFYLTSYLRGASEDED